MHPRPWKAGQVERLSHHKRTRGKRWSSCSIWLGLACVLRGTSREQTDAGCRRLLCTHTLLLNLSNSMQRTGNSIERERRVSDALSISLKCKSTIPRKLASGSLSMTKYGRSFIHDLCTHLECRSLSELHEKRAVWNPTFISHEALLPS